MEASMGRVVTLHCTTLGDYEPLQCDDGLCWCAEPKTGQPTVTPVPDVDMTRLPCCKYSEGPFCRTPEVVPIIPVMVLINIHTFKIFQYFVSVNTIIGVFNCIKS